MVLLGRDLIMLPRCLPTGASVNSHACSAFLEEDPTACCICLPNAAATSHFDNMVDLLP